MTAALTHCGPRPRREMEMAIALMLYAAVAVTILVTDVAFGMQVLLEVPWWVYPLRAIGWPVLAGMWVAEMLR